MVVGREGDHERFGARSRQIGRPERAVASVSPDGLGPVDAERGQNRGGCATDGTEASVSLADVVEEGGPNDHGICTGVGDQPGTIVGVALVGDRLRPEGVSLVRAQAVGDPPLLTGVEASCREERDESTCEMAGGAGERWHGTA